MLYFKHYCFGFCFVLSGIHEVRRGELFGNVVPAIVFIFIFITRMSRFLVLGKDKKMSYEGMRNYHFCIRRSCFLQVVAEGTALCLSQRKLLYNFFRYWLIIEPTEYLWENLWYYKPLCWLSFCTGESRTLLSNELIYSRKI